MFLKKHHLLKQILFPVSAILLFLLIALQQSCKKTDLGAVENKKVNVNKTEQFFKLPANANSALQRVAEELKKQNTSKEFIEEFIAKQGFAIWNKASIFVKADNANTPSNNSTTPSFGDLSGFSDTTIYIPLVLDSAKQVNAFIKATVTDTVSMRLFKNSDYQNFPFQTPTPLTVTTAENYALRMMQMDKDVFGHTAFNIKDKKLFNNSIDYRDTGIITRVVEFGNATGNPIANGVTMNNVSHTTCITINTTTTSNHCPYQPNQCPDISTGVIGPCDNCQQYCANISYSSTTQCITWEEEGGGGWPIFPPGGGGGGVGGGNPPPCSVMGPIVSTNNPIAGCPPVPNVWPPIRDANGYLYSRIAELQNKLAQNPFALEPCDSLNIMPLDPNNGFGTMYQRVAQFTPSQYVKDRIDSIKNVAFNWVVDNFYTTNINNANGGVINCDFFPVRITQMPNGFTPETLVEYFRKNINQFVDSSLGISFSPYNDAATFFDTAKFNAHDTNSVGSLIHIHMTNDGSVIESGYYHNYTAGLEKHRFTFTTMATPLDLSHPVAGNREFGVYRSQDSQNPNDFVFYTMGVDRINDWVFSSGDWINRNLFGNPSGFEQADELWKNLQKNMINFINNPTNGGHAEYYGPSSVKARPKYADVKEYLMGTITWETLKQRLGC